MTPPTLVCCKVVEISGAGRGVVASKQISEETLILKSPRPAAHVIHWEFRKEVCAQCFHYDRGRTLPVRYNPAAKVFCSNGCFQRWREEQGVLGIQAWENLKNLVTKKNSVIANDHGLPGLGSKPDREVITATWGEAEEESKRVIRCQSTLNSSARVDTAKRDSQTPQPRKLLSVDPDIIGYLLSGVLLHSRNSEKWDEAIMTLVRDERPYRSARDLEAHCDSFLQLIAIISVELLPSCTPGVCQTLISVASHNSFGIRSGSEEGEEYMGYGLYPEASYFNHSCNPNISKERMGREWAFLTLRVIDEGEECCISYLGGDEKELPIHERRKRLSAHWEFHCTCMRCKDEDRS